MRVSGTFRLQAPRAEVYRAVCDPAVLMAVIPGCEAVEEVHPGVYHGRISLRLPGVVGTYQTRVTLVDTQPPERAGLEGRLDGGLGTLRGRADFTLSEVPDGTVMVYHGQGTIGGPLARLDSRFAERLAESLISQGLRALDLRLAGTPSDARPAPDAGAATPPTTEVPE